MHYQMGIWNACMNFLNTVDSQNIACWLFAELVSAMASANCNSQCITLRSLHKISSLLNVSQQLFTSHLTVSAMTIFFIALHRFK